MSLNSPKLSGREAYSFSQEEKLTSYPKKFSELKTSRSDFHTLTGHR